MRSLPGGTRIGRVALDVADLDETAAFYGDVAGLDVLAREDGRVVLGAGGEELLELRAAPDAPPRPAAAAGLFHAAYRLPSRAALADALARLRGSWRLSGASDHLVSEALYCRDPEDNGVEVYRDRPREQWERTPDGGVRIDTLALDLEALAADAGAGTDGTVPPGTDVGHVHLEVTDLDRARAFYVDALGFDVKAGMERALFLAAGDYHHHVGLNTWQGRSGPAAGRGLAWFELVLPDDGALERTVERLADAGHPPVTTADGATVEDPDGIELRLTVAE